MIFLFLGNLVFGSAAFSIRTHPSFSGVKEEVVGSLLQVFGEDSGLLQGCLNTIKPGDVSIFDRWEKITEKYPVVWQLHSSQGRIESSPREFFYSLCFLSSFQLEAFGHFYRGIPQDKRLSASFLMILSVLSDNLNETLTKFQEIIDDMSPCKDEDGDEGEAPVRRFSAFSEACEKRFLPDSWVIKYMGNPEEDSDDLDDEQREQGAKAFLEVLMCSYLRLRVASTAAQSDRDE